jgi:hypothetical protein
MITYAAINNVSAYSEGKKQIRCTKFPQYRACKNTLNNHQRLQQRPLVGIRFRPRQSQTRGGRGISNSVLATT